MSTTDKTDSSRRQPPSGTLGIALGWIKVFPNHYLFPIRAGQKAPPLFKRELELASNDPKQLTAWAAKFPKCNWGIALKKSRLIVPDVDTKPGKVGQATLDALELMYGELPPTLTVRTPSGGKHFYFTETNIVRHVMRVSGFGKDVDSTNYVLIPGCKLDIGGAYTAIVDAPIAPAPDWFAEFLDKPAAAATNQTPDIELDKPENISWAINYLKNDAPPCIQGSNGEYTLLMVAGELKDRGISRTLAIELINEHYNVEGKCEPRWNVGDGPIADRLDVKVNNAYGFLKQNAPGSATPEADFGGDTTADAIASLPADIVAAGERQQASEKAAGKETWESIKAGWVYVGQQKQFVRLSDGKMWDVDAFEKQFGYVKDGMRGPTGSAPTSLTKVIFSCRPGQGLRTFDSFVFMPGKGEDYRGDFNQWRKSEVEPKQGDTSLWDAHLAYLFPDEGTRNIVLNWMAWVYQNPTLHPNHSLLVQGLIQGTGKSFLPEAVEKLLSATPATPLSQRALEADHNAWVLRTRLARIEIRAANKKLSDILHDLITGPMVHVDMKGQHDFDIPNVMAFWLEANPVAALSDLDNSDRRHAIVSTDQPNKPLQPREPGYYAKLYGVDGRGGLINDPAGLAAIAYALKARDLEGYSAQGRAPATEAKRTMMRAAAPEIDRWMIEHHDDAPLSYSLVTIEEVLAALPDGLKSSRGARDRIAFVLGSPEFNGENIGKVRLGGRQARQLRLWAINRTRADASVRGKFKDAVLAKIYRREHMTVTDEAIADQERAAEQAQGDFAGDTV